MTTETLEIKRVDAIKAYNKADKQGKSMLADLFGDKVLNQKITDRVKTFADVLEIAGISQNKFDNSCANLSADEVAYRQVKLIAEVLNEGWTPNWDNSGQYKYYPFFDKRAGFSFSRDDGSYPYGCTGSRLCFSSAALAVYAGKQFTSIYKAFLTV